LAGGDLDETVRRADPDRWLASRFVSDPAARNDVIALYAFDIELDRARRVTTSALAAEIRLTWWWEALGEMFGQGALRAHPLARTLADVIARRSLPRSLLEAMIDARLEVTGHAMLDEAMALAWADGVGGSAAVLAATILDPAGESQAARPAGRILGLMRLVRDGRLERTAGSAIIRRTLTGADAAARGLTPAGFPAVAAAALVRGELEARPPSELSRRLRLAWAVARGRL
jgi:phytoene synthase